MDFELSKFDQYREVNRKEVKTATFAVPVSVWDTYSSFANTYGGVIILGVEEKRTGVGVLRVSLIKNNSSRTSGTLSTIKPRCR